MDRKVGVTLAGISIKKGESIPFDVAATRIIQFDIRDLDSVEAAKTEIVSQVKSLEAGKNEIHNPISVSLDLKMLKEGNAEERSLADVVEAISDLRVAVTSIDKSSKFLDEFKIIANDLQNKFENNFDNEFRRRRRKFHPMMLEEIMHMEMKLEDPNLSFLMMLSLIKDDFPWLYELGLETYRGLKSSKSQVEKRKLIETFERAFEMLRHPMMREFYGKSEELYMFNKDIRHYMHRFLERFLNEEIPRTLGDEIIDKT